MTTTNRTETSGQTDDLEQGVLDRYEDGANEQKEELYCSTEYDESYLEVIPDETRVADDDVPSCGPECC